MWNKKSEAIKQKSGGFLGIGKSSQVTGYRYYTSFAAFIGNRIEKFIAINFDNRGWIVHDPTKHPFNMLPVNKPSLFGQDAGGVVGNIDIELGFPQPQQNLAYKQHFYLVSAYPYQSYLVFRGNTINQPFYFGNSNYMKEMLLWVKRTRVRNDGQGQWYEVRGDGAFVCEIDATLIPYDYLGFVAQVQANPPQNKWYGTWNEDDQYHEFTQKGLIGGYVHDFHAQYGGYGKEGRVKTTFPNFDGLVMEIEIWADDGISFFDWKGGGFVLVKQWSEQAYITCRKYWIIFDPDSPIKDLSFGVTDQIPGGSNTNHKCVIWAKLVLDPWSMPGGSGSNTAFDINPIHKIREILTDDTAMAKPEVDVNNQNFMKAADRIWNEGLGISWAIDEKSCIDAIEELCYHIEAGIRVNRQTGLYEMVLFRDDWFAGDEIHTIAENKIKDLSLEVMNSDDIVNQLNVTYYDRERIKNSTFSVYENGSILTMGKANAESIEFPYFMNMRNAEIVSNWKLKQYSTPAWKGTFTTGWREARKWNRYDLVKINWSKKWQGTILARIMKIDLGNGLNNEVMIDFEEVVPYSGEMNTSIVVDDSTETKPMPPQSAVFKTFEIPYYDLAQLKTQSELDLELARNPNIGFVGVVAGRPQQNSIDAQLHTESDVGYEFVSSVEYASFARTDEPVNRTQQSFVVKNEDLSVQFRQDSLIMLGDEIVIYKSYDAETKTLTVERGALDTIPQNHIENTVLYFYDDAFAYDPEGYTPPKTANATVLTTTPSGVESLETSPKRQIEIESRAIRPYPPANVKINGEYFPADIETDLVITWSDRNRLNLNVIDWYSPSVVIEQDTQTHLIVSQLDESQIELATSNVNVTGATSYTMSVSAMQADTQFVKITLKTLRDGYECLQPFEYTVELSQFFSAPYDLTVEFKDD
ncbi:hypothetical protein [Acinetobacter towneri]|uniref:hypothetical protein n=1 Tax=Acinetobacter towneri TaxID=202956 RepID=UPI003B029239